MKSVTFNSILILPNSCLQVKALSFLLVDVIHVLRNHEVHSSDKTLNSPYFHLLFSTTVVPKRASVTFIVKVKGVV